jgi:hypothetical protein
MELCFSFLDWELFAAIAGQSVEDEEQLMSMIAGPGLGFLFKEFLTGMQQVPELLSCRGRQGALSGGVCSELFTQRGGLGHGSPSCPLSPQCPQARLKAHQC